MEYEGSQIGCGFIPNTRDLSTRSGGSGGSNSGVSLILTRRSYRVGIFLSPKINGNIDPGAIANVSGIIGQL